MDYLKDQVVVVLVIDELEGLEIKIEKLVSDGYKVFEVTLRTACAIEAIKLIKRKFPDLKLGAGTILDELQLEKAIESGADFGVSPGFNSAIVTKAQELKFDFIPGVATATEIETAKSAGFSVLKLFPAESLGGVNLIKALSGPYPEILFMPTGGINQENHKNYLELNSVICVGGSWMTK